MTPEDARLIAQQFMQLIAEQTLAQPSAVSLLHESAAKLSIDFSTSALSVRAWNALKRAGLVKHDGQWTIPVVDILVCSMDSIPQVGACTFAEIAGSLVTAGVQPLHLKGSRFWQRAPLRWRRAASLRCSAIAAIEPYAPVPSDYTTGVVQHD